MFNYSFSLGVAISSLLICAVNLTYTLIQRQTDKRQNKYFIIIVVILLVNSITGIFSALSDGKVFSQNNIKHVFQISRYVYFITHTALCPMFYYYVSEVNLFSKLRNDFKSWFVSLFFILTEVLALTNPLTHWVYSIDENNNFNREWGEGLIYLAALFYSVFAFAILIISWNVISTKRKTALFFFFVLVAVGVVIQLVFKNVKVEVLCESLGFIGVLMSVENEDDRIDFGTGFYNRAALNLDIQGCLAHNRKVDIIGIHIVNYDIINRLVGSEETNVIGDILSDYLKSKVHRYYIYATSMDTLVITLYDKSEEEVDKLTGEIVERFSEPWDYKDFRIMLNPKIICASIPKQISTTAELFYMMDNPPPHNIEKTLLKGDDLNYIIRRQAIENAISRGFNENSFEVYYQPTFHLNRKLHGAEALVRMHDKELGNIYPDEFIPIAEQTGLIDDIDDYVLEEVCKFFKTGIPKKYGIDNINVNLSVLQCMRPGFVENINRIVEKSGIDKKLINFEITESIAADDYQTLSDVIYRLKNVGFLFSMDDYGTGYSNVSAVFSLNLDVIKIDKSILWGAEKSELGMIILENTIRMIRQMKKKILVEGVETKEQIELLEKLGVDYLQGFYFSKPVPKTEFINYISMHQ